MILEPEPMNHVFHPLLPNHFLLPRLVGKWLLIYGGVVHCKLLVRKAFSFLMDSSQQPQ